LGNFLKKVPQTPQKLPEKTGKNSYIAFFKWVNRLHLSFFQESFEVPSNFLKSVLVGGRGSQCERCFRRKLATSALAHEVCLA